MGLGTPENAVVQEDPSSGALLEGLSLNLAGAAEGGGGCTKMHMDESNGPPHFLWDMPYPRRVDVLGKPPGSSRDSVVGFSILSAGQVVTRTEATLV